MTDVLSHADPTHADGRRRARGHRAQRGLRVPGAGPEETPAGDAPARHRRPAGTGPLPALARTGPPTGPTGNRHHAPDPDDEPRTVETARAVLRSAVPAPVPPPAPARPTGSHRAPEPHRPVPAAEPTVVTARPTTAASAVRTGSHRADATPDAVPDAAPEVEMPAVGPRTGSHRAPKATRGVPLRATIGVVGIGGVAALFAMTTPGSPLTTSAPAEPLPRAAAQADLVTPEPAAPPVQAVPVAPPAVSVSPTTQEQQPVVGALFDLAAGSLSRLFDNSGNSGLVENASRPQIVANPDDPGRQAWQFTLGPGGKRSEVLPQGRGTTPQDGEEQYVRYTARLSDDFPTDVGSWQLLLQWHHAAPDGSPPLALQVVRGQLMMVVNGDEMRSIGAVSPGDTIDLTMHVKFSQTPGEGAVTVWRSGQPTGVTNWTPRQGTMSTEAAYLKMGMYRDPNIRQGGSVLVTDLKIGRDPAGIGGIGPRPVD
ncbi:hypothetical protein GCM10023200_01020 [Actinomycetospora chlora]|uniref:Polysaccharide lyase-like protein n=1 Tax=Actinomycetospora chlora TaxID=663608 RepID=A0ABP9A3S4_9PSEU